jgi:hypothetical protein
MKEDEQMADTNELTVEDFTKVTQLVEQALDQINTLYTSSALTDEEKSELGRIGRSIYERSHELDHLFLRLESVPDKLKEELKAYYEH